MDNIIDYFCQNFMVTFHVFCSMYLPVISSFSKIAPCDRLVMYFFLIIFHLVGENAAFVNNYR